MDDVAALFGTKDLESEAREFVPDDVVLLLSSRRLDNPFPDLGANRVVRICMEAEYYAFENADSGFGNCGYEKFKDPTCYGLKPLLELQKFFTKEKN